MKQNNPVAKNLREFNKAVVHKDKKKEQKLNPKKLTNAVYKTNNISYN